MKLNVPPKIRATLYVLTSVGTPVIGYLFAMHYISELEVALWGSEVTVVGLLAAFNTDTSK